MKFGYEAIKYILTKTLTKKGVKGIPTIPGKAFDMRMKQLVNEMANKMKALGYDINKVTEKTVQGLLDSAEAVAKQKAKAEALKHLLQDLFDVSLCLPFKFSLFVLTFLYLIFKPCGRGPCLGGMVVVSFFATICTCFHL